MVSHNRSVTKRQMDVRQRCQKWRTA